ncbi:ThuA domain-containing protein, partial [Saccharomonospora viridis]
MGRRSLGRSLHGRARPNLLRRTTVLMTSTVLVAGLSTMSASGQPETALRAAPEAGSAKADPVQVLVYHGEAAEQDDPVDEAADTIRQLGTRAGFTVDVSSDPAVFTSENLD